MKFALAGSCTESSLGERQERLSLRRDIQADGTLAVQLFQSDSFDERMLGVEQGPDHVIFRIEKTLVLKTHSLGQKTENFDVRFGLARRRKGWPRQLQIVMAIGQIQIRVFEKSGHRQQNVGMIRGVGLELL